MFINVKLNHEDFSSISHYYRAFYLLRVIQVLIVVGIIFIVSHYYTINAWRYSLCLGISVIMGLVLLFTLPKFDTNKSTPYHCALFILYFALASATIVTGGHTSFTRWWFMIVPVLSFLMLSSRETVIWTAITLLSPLGFYLGHKLGLTYINELEALPQLYLELMNILMLSGTLIMICWLNYNLRYALEAENLIFEKNIAQASKLALMGEFTSNIAHEIKNPLTIINGNTQAIALLFEKELVDRSLILKKIDKINDVTNRVSELLDSMRVLSRNDTDDMKPVCFCDTLKNVVAIIQQKYTLSNTRLIIDQNDSNFKSIVHANLVQISQVLLNVLTNALHAVKDQEDRWVKVELEVMTSMLRVRVIDSGNGISEELREKLFDTFFTTKEIGVGTGLGLSLSKRIMKRHYGDIWVDPEHPHTCFVIDIPLARMQEVA